jgi:hypothetical protein
MKHYEVAIVGGAIVGWNCDARDNRKSDDGAGGGEALSSDPCSRMDRFVVMPHT